MTLPRKLRENDAVRASLGQRIGARVAYIAARFRALGAIVTSRNISKALRFVARGDLVFVARAARNLCLQRLANMRGGDVTSVPAELFEVLPAEPGVPLVSVVIPCVNHGAFVGEAVASALAQTFRSLEIIVVDGGSDDGATPAVVAALAGPRVRVLLRQGPPKVLGDNRNFGITHARGRYVCCLDADDVLSPTYIEKTLFVLEQGGFDVVGASLVEFGSRTQEWRLPPAPTLDDFVLQNQTICCALFRKDVWAHAGGYSEVTLERDGIPEDWEFWIRLAAMGARFRNISGETLMRYRVRGPGTSLSSASGLPSREAQRCALNSRLRALLTPEAMALSRREAARRLRPANRITPMSEVLAYDSDTRRSGARGGGRTLLVALPFLHIGGAERLLSQVAEGLAREGWRVIVVATGVDDPACGDSLSWFEAATSECYALNRFLRRDDWQRFTRQLLHTRKPDVLLNAGSTAIYELLPEIAAEYPAMARIDLLFNVVGHAEEHLSRRAFFTGALCENGEVLDWLTGTAGWPSDRVAMVPNGVNTSLYSPGVRPASLAERLGIKPSDIVVGWAGRMAEEKSPETFVELARRCSNISGLRFVMAGDGPLARRVAASAGRHGPTLCGLIEDMPNFYRLCDLFVLTSRLDGRPNTVLEAQASGCAVIASRVGGIPEMVAEGRSALLAKPGDAASFEAALREVVSSPESLMRMRAEAATAAKCFSLDMMVEGYRAALERAALVAAEIHSHAGLDPIACLHGKPSAAPSAAKNVVGAGYSASVQRFR
jgi:glycosyltransferase involved in cell wall biosynthesis